MSSIIESGYESWRYDAAEAQQKLSEGFGDRIWDEVPVSPKNNLQTKLSIAFFNGEYDQLSAEDKNSVDATVNKILELAGSRFNILINFVFVSVCIKDTRDSCIVPIARTRGKYSETEYFVEKQPGRIYQGWPDYKDNNKLPPCFMCYPVDGKYQRENGRVLVEYQESPSCNNTFKIIDIIAGVGGLASTFLLTAAAFIPVFTPFVIGAFVATGATTAYSTGRSISHLADRGAHGQSISLDDAEARAVWLNMISNIVGGVMIGGAAVLPRLVAGGKLTSAIATSAIEIVSYASIAVNSFGIIAVVVTLIFKFRDGTLCETDITQFISACFFFANIVLPVRVASNIIETLSHQPSRMVNLFRMVRNTAFETVKTVINAAVVGFGKIMEIISGPLPCMVLRHFNMDPLASIVEKSLRTIQRFVGKDIGPVEMLTIIHRLFSTSVHEFMHEIQMAIKTLEKCFIQALEKIRINGWSLFSGSSRVLALEVVNEIQRPVQNLTIKNAWIKDENNRMVSSLSQKFAQSIDCQSGQEYVQLCKFLSNKIIADCDRRLIVRRSEETRITPADNIVFHDVVNEMENRQTLTKLAKEYKSLPGRAVNSKKIFSKPIYVQTGVEFYLFETSYEFRPFDQFLYDASVELLGPTDPFDGSEILLHDRMLTIQQGAKSLLFSYEVTESKSAATVKVPARVTGVAMLVDQKTAFQGMPPPIGLRQRTYSNLPRPEVARTLSRYFAACSPLRQPRTSPRQPPRT